MDLPDWDGSIKRFSANSKRNMKAKILEYSGAHKAVVEGGKVVKLAVNNVHPLVGEELEFDAKQVVAKVEKSEEPKK